jgi:WD40 repeat protein
LYQETTWTPKDALSTFQISPDGGTLVTTETRRLPSTARHSRSSLRQFLLKVYEWPTKKKTREIELAGSVNNAVSFSPSGRLLATQIRSRIRDNPTRRWISVWEIETGFEVARIRGYEASAFRVAFSPDEKRLSSTHADTTILVWDLAQFQGEVPGQD